MDPKALASLDPKLRETYERVMGTSASFSTHASGASPATPPSTGFDQIGSGGPTATSSLTQSGPTPAPPIPAPIGSSVPNIPPSSPTRPDSSTTTMIVGQPIQASDIAALQSTPTGNSPSKPLQPLPSPASINQTVNASSHSSSPIIRMLYIIAFLIFVVVYTIFWFKIFNYSLPF